MFNLIKTLQYNILVDCVAEFFLNQEYDLVLKHLPKPYIDHIPHAVYANIFRFLSLKKLDDDKWESEYEYLLSEKLLDVFQENEREYLGLFLQNHLSEFMDTAPPSKMDFDKVPKRTKKRFPVNKHEN